MLAYLETAPYPRTLAYYAAGSASRTGSVSLPADYSSFAYTTGSAVAGTHRIFAWQASPLSYLGRAERVYDSSPDIASTLNAAPVALKLNASAAARPPDWQYTVRLDANGGKVGKAASASLKRAKGSALGALPTPTRTGHTFLGWYTGKTAGTRVTASTKVTGDATYYAHWKKGVCTVRLDANGGRMPAKTASSFRRTYGTALGALPAPARANCTFLGWYTAKSKGTKVTTGTKATRSVTLYARWKANGPIVTLNANGGKVGKSARASLVRAKGAAIGKLSTPKRTGYIFKGWFTGKAKGTRVTAATKATRSVTLYAHWKAKSYTVKLNANGGKLGKSAISSTKRSYDAKFGRLATPKRTGYKFDGWYTKRSGGTKVTASTKATRAVTLYAHWKRAR
ncbi:MAG: InlB B-repeat-containing protein [Coriobacteriales bacterium]|nr:InlB B-repeat-containing protein [Coriobacteriales bacterium]